MGGIVSDLKQYILKRIEGIKYCHGRSEKRAGERGNGGIKDSHGHTVEGKVEEKGSSDEELQVCKAYSTIYCDA